MRLQHLILNTCLGPQSPSPHRTQTLETQDQCHHPHPLHHFTLFDQHHCLLTSLIRLEHTQFTFRITLLSSIEGTTKLSQDQLPWLLPLVFKTQE